MPQYKCPECRRKLKQRYEDVLCHNEVINTDMYYCKHCNKDYMINEFIR